MFTEISHAGWIAGQCFVILQDLAHERLPALKM